MMQDDQNYAGQTIAGLNTRTVMYGLLILGGLLIALIASRFGFGAGMLFAVSPFVLFAVFAFISSPYAGLMGIFTANYFLMGIQRYASMLPLGVGMDVLIGLTLLGVLIQACYKRVDLKAAANGLTAASGIWMLYCFLEIFNLEGPPLAAWYSTVRGVAGYFFIVSILVPLLFNHYRDLWRILYMWSAFTLVAVVKAYIQKNYGFDQYEMRWLYERGESTHLIQSGIRYFSIFTDAANFGAGMGFSMVTFSLVALAIKKWPQRLYFLFVALAAGYAMMISGTRGAIAVPFAGFALYVVLSRNWKVIILMSVMLVGAYWFLSETMYLHGNAYVRRMRGAFNPNDPSLLVRLENQKKMRVYLKSRPFGVGIGMGGVKSRNYVPNAYMGQLPTDSWFVMIWAETGIVGLLIYVSILVYLLIKCSWIIMFRIKDRTLRGVLGGCLAGIFGTMISSTGNEIMGQFPTGIVIYTLLAFIFMGPRFDKQIEEEQARLNPAADAE